MSIRFLLLDFGNPTFRPVELSGARSNHCVSKGLRSSATPAPPQPSLNSATSSCLITRPVVGKALACVSCRFYYETKVVLTHSRKINRCWDTNSKRICLEVFMSLVLSRPTSCQLAPSNVDHVGCPRARGDCWSTWVTKFPLAPSLNPVTARRDSLHTFQEEAETSRNLAAFIIPLSSCLTQIQNGLDKNTSTVAASWLPASWHGRESRRR